MPITREQIQARLVQEQYQKFVVADIGNFPWCLKKSPEGLASGERYKKYSQSATARTPPFSTWGIPQLISPDTAQGFINFAKQRNNTKGFKIDGEPVRVSECSNFAYHAAGVLLDTPAIKAEYDVAVLGSMYNRDTHQYQHNITLLVPKGTVLPQPPTQLTEANFPRGALIVDPWAVGMGQPVKEALAVTKEQFAYGRSLFPATVNYQSALDPTLAETPTGKLKPYTGESPPPVAQDRQSVPSQVAPVETVSSQPSQIPPKNQDHYTKLWQKAFAEIQSEPRYAEIRGNTEKEKIQAIRTVLDDYTKGGDTWWSKFKRIITGHWNRHHVADVDKVVQAIDRGDYANSKAVFTALDQINRNPEKKVNQEGTFKEQLDFIKDKVKPDEPDQAPQIQMT